MVSVRLLCRSCAFAVSDFLSLCQIVWGGLRVINRFAELSSGQCSWLMLADMPAAARCRMALTSVTTSPWQYTIRLDVQTFSKTWQQHMCLEWSSERKICPQLKTATVTNLILWGSWTMQMRHSEVGYCIFFGFIFLVKIQIKSCITTFARIYHLFLSWARLIQSLHPQPKRSVSLRSPPQNPPCTSSIHSTCLAHLILLDLVTQIMFGGEYRS